jgi:hypothetical protein
MTPPPVYKKINNMDLNQTIINTFYPKIFLDASKETGIPKNRFINLMEALGGEKLSMMPLFNTTDFIHPNAAG